MRTNATLVPGRGEIAPFWFKVAEDITPRKRVDEELRQQVARLCETEARLQALVEHSPNVVFLEDRQGRYLYFNKGFKRALRISDGQIKGKKDDEVFAA